MTTWPAKRVGVLVLAAALIAAVVGVGVAVLGGDSEPPKQANPPGSTAAPTTEPAAGPDRPAVVVTMTTDRIAVVDTGTGREVRTLYQLPDPVHTAFDGMTVTADRQTVHFAVLGGDPAGNCNPTHYAVPVAGGTVVEVPDLGGRPAFSPDGRWVAFGVDSSRHGGPAGPGFHCRQAIMVRDLATGEERVWTEKATTEPTSVSDTEVTWSVDSQHLLFQRTYNDPDPESGDGVTELRALDITRSGTIESASQVLASGKAPLSQETGTDQQLALPGSPVGVAGGVAYARYGRYDDNHRWAAIVVRDDAGGEQILVPQRAVNLSGVTVDRRGRYLLAWYDDGVQVVDLDGHVETLLKAAVLAVW